MQNVSFLTITISACAKPTNKKYDFLHFAQYCYLTPNVSDKTCTLCGFFLFTRYPYDLYLSAVFQLYVNERLFTSFNTVFWCFKAPIQRVFFFRFLPFLLKVTVKRNEQLLFIPKWPCAYTF